jgi:YbbR domain-containing protein
VKPAETPQRSLLARLVLNDWPLKVVALVSSVALFSLVHSDQDAQRAISLDVVALLPPPHVRKMLVSDLPTQVKVTIRGSRARVAALQRDDFAAIQMDLRDPSLRSFRFDKKDVDVPGAVHVVAIDPPEVELSWAVAAERRVPVRARLRGTPDEGHMVKRPVLLEPSTIVIRGPADELKSVDEVFTDDVAVDGVVPGVHERRVQLEALAGHLAYADQGAVSVRLEIVPEVGDRVLRKLELAVVGEGDARLRPTVVSVALRGPVRSLVEVDASDIVPYVDVSKVASGPGFVPVDVAVRGVPEGFEVVRVMPASVLVQRKL